MFASVKKSPQKLITAMKHCFRSQSKTALKDHSSKIAQQC